MRELTVKKNDAGQRLDKFLTKSVKGLPTSMMYKLIRTKKIKVNRKRAEQSYMLCEGDTVQLFIRDEFFDSPEKDMGALSRITPKLSVLYEDENIILLNKRPDKLIYALAKRITAVKNIELIFGKLLAHNPFKGLLFKDIGK